MSINHPYIKLTEYQDQVLTGLMLGDGHLDKVNKNAHLSLNRSIKDLEYLKFESNIFYNFLTPLFQNHLVKMTLSFDKRSSKYYEGCYFRTARNGSLTEYHYKWYNGTKILPKDLKLSSPTMAHWIADDGHITYNKLPYRFVLELSTHSFTENEVEFLIKLLSDRYKEKFLPSFKNKKYFIIKAYDSACRSIFKDIDPYFKMIRKRIWDMPESRFYSNIPERQISTKDEFAKRAFKMQEIFNNNNSISLKELKNQLLYGDKVSYNSLRSILLPFKDKITKVYEDKKLILIFNH